MSAQSVLIKFWEQCVQAERDPSLSQLQCSRFKAGLACRTDWFPSEMLFLCVCWQEKLSTHPSRSPKSSQKNHSISVWSMSFREILAALLLQTSNAAQLAVCLSFISFLVWSRAWVSIPLLLATYLQIFIYEEGLLRADMQWTGKSQRYCDAQQLSWSDMRSLCPSWAFHHC